MSIDLYVYKELNVKMGDNVDRDHHIDDFNNKIKASYFGILSKNYGPGNKIYSFKETTTPIPSIPSLANNCLVLQTKNFSPKNINYKGDLDQNFSGQFDCYKYGYKPIFMIEHEHVTTVANVKSNYQYFVQGNYLFISAKQYSSNDEFRTIFHLESAPLDFPNIIISTGYIVVCSKISLNTLKSNANVSATDTVYLAMLDTTTGSARNSTNHPLTNNDMNVYANLRTTGVAYTFYEVAKIFLDDELKLVSLAVIGNNLCLFKYNYRAYYSENVVNNKRFVGLIFHWFCGSNITTSYRFYDTDLTYDRTVPFVFTNTTYQYSNMYTPLFFTKNYDELVQAKLSNVKEVLQPMSLNVNNGNKNVSLVRVIGNNNIYSEVNFTASNNADYYHFSPGSVINTLKNNIPFPLRENEFLPNICSADEHFP